MIYDISLIFFVMERTQIMILGEWRRGRGTLKVGTIILNWTM